MKKFFAFVIMLIFLTMELLAQNVKFAQDSKLDYKPLTVFAGVDQSVGDTSSVVEVPYDITNIIYYLEIDTISSGDSIKTAIIQWSSSGTNNWVNVDTITATVGATGVTRKVASYPVGRYFRFIFAVAGSGVAYDFRLRAIAKK